MCGMPFLLKGEGRHSVGPLIARAGCAAHAPGCLADAGVTGSSPLLDGGRIAW